MDKDQEPKEMRVPYEFTYVTAGGWHTCGIDVQNKTRCWGDNEHGQIDIPLASFTSLSAGLTYTCGITDTQDSLCWGDNTHGQSDVPNESFVQIDAGIRHTCGRTTTGSILCWGDDTYGQASPPAGTFIHVTAGELHSCGVTTENDVVCWGDDSHGQSSPAEGTHQRVFAGPQYSCGLYTNGHVACWGIVPGEVPETTFVDLSVGLDHNCGVTTENGCCMLGRGCVWSVQPQRRFVYPCFCARLAQLRNQSRFFDRMLGERFFGAKYTTRAVPVGTPLSQTFFVP